MMLFSMSDIVYKPIYPFKTMIIIAVVLLVVVVLNRKHIINRVLIIALLLIISQRPMLKNQNEMTYNMNLDIMFVIDNTVSMNAVDVNGMTRLNAVKIDCKKIMAMLPGANYAIITYSNISQVKYPFTNDTAIIDGVFDQMKVIDPVYATGSTLDMPYDNINLLLTSSSKKDKHQQIVFFMGDGELVGKEKSNTNIDKYKNISALIDGGAVLGYGTVEGSKVKITESIGLKQLVDSQGYLIDSTTKKAAISKLNEDNLKALSNSLSLDYYHMTDFSILSDKNEEIKKNSVVDDDAEQKMDKDIYYYFSGALVILLVIELFHYRRDEQ